MSIEVPRRRNCGGFRASSIQKGSLTAVLTPVSAGRSRRPRHPQRRTPAPLAPARPVAVAADGALDSLQLFLNEASRYPLLTAKEEIELAQRIERGDLEAKERMINSNLRLVVSIA